MKQVLEALTAMQGIANEFTGLFSPKNPSRQYFFINNGGLRAMQLYPADIIGKTDDEILSPQNAKLARKTDLEAFDSATPIEFINHIVLNDKPISYLAVRWVIYRETGMPFCLCTLGDLLENREDVWLFRDRIFSVTNKALGKKS